MQWLQVIQEVILKVTVICSVAAVLLVQEILMTIQHSYGMHSEAVYKQIIQFIILASDVPGNKGETKMKKIIIVSVMLIAFAGITLLASIIIVNNDHDVKEELQVIHPDEKNESSCCPTDVGFSEYSENSIYQLESKWKNQNAKEMELGELKGKVQVVSLIFTNCTYACPILLNDMKKVEAELNENLFSKVNFTLISIDDERDTPDVLKTYSINKNIDLNYWNLLTSEKENIRELAALFGFKYKKEENGEYSHSNMIIVLDQSGEIVYVHTGLNNDVSEIVKIVNTLTSKKIS